MANARHLRVLSLAGDQEGPSRLPILPKPEVVFNIPESGVGIIEDSVRRHIGGLLRNLTLIVLTKGCPYDCSFCSPKQVANPDFHVHGDKGKEAARKIVDRICELIRDTSAEFVRIFNNGNILHGTEYGNIAELNDFFWELLPDELEKLPDVKAVDLEVRLSEFVDGQEGDHQQELKQILRDRLIVFQQKLAAMGKNLRIILALEYIESDKIAKTNKFPQASTDSDQRVKNNFLEAVAFLRKHKIACHVYAMLGGRLKDRTLGRDESINSAVETVLFALQNGAEEADINSCYVDPINEWEVRCDGIPFYVPTEQDMVETLRIIAAKLDALPKIQGKIPRVRLTADKENVIKDVRGPDVSKPFLDLVRGFNDAPDQALFFEQNMADLKFSTEGKCAGEDFN